MKTIVCVNFTVPTVSDYLGYDSEGSLRDYDIAIFNPTLPHYSRVDFSAGGSCISIEGTRQLTKAMAHWSSELSCALSEGKTIFVILSTYKEDQAATGSSMTSKASRTYNTKIVNNYSAAW